MKKSAEYPSIHLIKGMGMPKTKYKNHLNTPAVLM
jgi:hypothetical protein